MRISVENAVFGYRGRPPVLDGLSWEVGPGVTGLLGPNGAGKTTLLSLIVPLAAPRSGRIRIGDDDLSDRAGRARARRVLGFLPQRYTLAGELTVADTVSYAAWTAGLHRRECGAAAGRALERVDLAGFARRRVRTLSGGERQRVGLAAALAHDPRVLVLDEPTVGLDPAQRLRLREVVARLGEDRTVLLSTHLIEDVAHLCGTVGVLAAGRIAFSGSFDELEELIEGADGGTAYGSSFERAYEHLIRRVGEGAP